jgi:hypothetical protein
MDELIVVDSHFLALTMLMSLLWQLSLLTVSGFKDTLGDSFQSIQRMRFLSFDVGMKNLAQCDLEVAGDTFTTFSVNSWTVETCVEAGLNVNKTPLHELAPFFSTYVKKNLKKWLYENSDASKPKEFSRVFIENQPMGGRGAARNLKTKVLSHILQCAILDERPDLKVDFVHPGLKLKDMERLEGMRSTYRENKLYAIAKTTTLVTGPTNKTQDACKVLFLDKKNGKKDDLADAFLQGLIAGQMHASGQVVVPPEAPKKAKKPKAAAAGVAEAAVDGALAAPVVAPAVAEAPVAPKKTKAAVEAATVEAMSVETVGQTVGQTVVQTVGQPELLETPSGKRPRTKK